MHAVKCNFCLFLSKTIFLLEIQSHSSGKSSITISSMTEYGPCLLYNMKIFKWNLIYTGLLIHCGNKVKFPGIFTETFFWVNFAQKRTIKKADFVGIFLANFAGKQLVLCWFNQHFQRKKTAILPMFLESEECWPLYAIAFVSIY